MIVFGPLILFVEFFEEALFLRRIRLSRHCLKLKGEVVLELWVVEGVCNIVLVPFIIIRITRPLTQLRGPQSNLNIAELLIQLLAEIFNASVGGCDAPERALVLHLLNFNDYILVDELNCLLFALAGEVSPRLNLLGAQIC